MYDGACLGETMQHSTMTGGLPVGASAGGVRRLLGFWEEVAHAGKSDLSPNETIIWNYKHIKINNTCVFPNMVL